MNVLNIHERKLEANYEQVGTLIDSLSSDHDRFWPNHSWPGMKLDRPLSIGQMVDIIRLDILLRNTQRYNPSNSVSQIPKDSMDFIDTRL